MLIFFVALFSLFYPVPPTAGDWDTRSDFRGIRGWRGGDRCHPAAPGAVRAGQRGDGPASASRDSYCYGNCHQPGYPAGKLKHIYHTQMYVKKYLFWLIFWKRGLKKVVESFRRLIYVQISNKERKIKVSINVLKSFWNYASELRWYAPSKCFFSGCIAGFFTVVETSTRPWKD